MFDFKKAKELIQNFANENSDVLIFIAKRDLISNCTYYYLKVPADCYLEIGEIPVFIKLYSTGKCFVKLYNLTIYNSDFFGRYICIPMCIGNKKIITMPELIEYLNILRNFIEEWKIKYKEAQKKNIISKIEGI